jgi:ABC-2 type transport system ATP-binding protein
VVINSGKVIADGTPDELKRKVGGERLEVVVARPTTTAAAVAVLAPIAVDQPTADPGKGAISLELRDGMDGIAAAAVALKEAGIEVADFALRRPTLDDVFFNLVGHRAE